MTRLDDPWTAFAIAQQAYRQAIAERDAAVRGSAEYRAAVMRAGTTFGRARRLAKVTRRDPYPWHAPST